MNGREDKNSNDLFYTCSLIEYISRKTKNTPTEVVDALGKDKVTNIYSIADIYHSDNIDRVSDDFINECGIQTGCFDNVAPTCLGHGFSCYGLARTRGAIEIDANT